MQFWHALAEEWPALVSGLKWTVILSGTVSLSGLAGGCLLLFFLTHPSAIIRRMANAYVMFFIGTPLLALLFLMYYGLPTLGIDLSPFAASFIGFTLNVSAYNARYLMSGYKAIDAGERTAALAMGYGRRQIFRYLILPQSLRYAVPGLTSQIINNLKDSSIAFLIQFEGFLGFVQNFTSQNFYFFRGYAFAATGYLLMVTVLTLAARLALKRVAVPGFR
ncbi:MAG: amino acid ABC transporter permease [Spartobacteria bacterium]|nr:amino acid ABC transporter permease [Spartobacteria bacterium]